MKRTRYISMLSVAVSLLLATSCIKDTIYEADSLLTIAQPYFKIEGEAQHIEVDLTSLLSWEISPKETYTWCTLDKSSGGKGDFRLTFTCEKNLDQTRTATFVVKAATAIQEIVIEQDKLIPLLVVTPSTQNITGTAQVVNVDLYCNRDWTLTPKETYDWCTVDISSGGLGDHTLTFTCDETIFQSRTAEFTVQADTAIRTITINQTELGIENGAYAYKGKLYSNSSATLIKSSNLLYATYAIPDDNGIPKFVYSTSEDNGQNWSAPTPCATTVNELLQAKNIAPKRLKIHNVRDYYATFDMGDNNICLAKNTSSIDSEWLVWDGSSWVSWNTAVTAAPVLQCETQVSIVINNGSVYVYYMEGPVLKVATTINNSNWPANLEPAVAAYEFDAASMTKGSKSWSYPVEIDVKIHTGGLFVATYVDANRSIGTLTSNDGINFTLGEPLAPLEYYYMKVGVKDISYSVSESNGVTSSNAKMIYTIPEGDTQGVYVFSAE